MRHEPEMSDLMRTGEEAACVRTCFSITARAAGDKVACRHEWAYVALGVTAR